MIQINDDYYEDLTAETTVQLLDALKATADQLPAQAPTWDGPAPTGATSGRGQGAYTGKDAGVKSGDKIGGSPDYPYPLFIGGVLITEWAVQARGPGELWGE